MLYTYFDARDFNLRQADIASHKALELEPELDVVVLESADVAAALRAVRSGSLPQRSAHAGAPSRLPASYDTTTSYPAFVAQIIVITVLQSIGSGMLLIVICGAGEEGSTTRLGSHGPAYASSAGKAIIAQLPESEWPRSQSKP